MIRKVMSYHLKTLKTYIYIPATATAGDEAGVSGKLIKHWEPKRDRDRENKCKTQGLL